MHTEAINHDPAFTFFQTGAQVGNRPSMGSWLSYGLGSENKNLPAFCVLLSRGKGNGQGVYSKFGQMVFWILFTRAYNSAAEKTRYCI